MLDALQVCASHEMSFLKDCWSLRVGLTINRNIATAGTAHRSCVRLRSCCWIHTFAHWTGSRGSCIRSGWRLGTALRREPDLVLRQAAHRSASRRRFFCCSLTVCTKSFASTLKSVSVVGVLCFSLGSVLLFQVEFDSSFLVDLYEVSAGA